MNKKVKTNSVGNARYKRFDIQLSWATFLTRRIGTFETSLCFTQRATFAQRRMFNVLEVIL